MNEPQNTLLDSLDTMPVGSPPLDALLVGGKAAERRQRRTLIAGVAATTLLVIGGGAVATQALTGTGDSRGDDSLIADETNDADGSKPSVTDEAPDVEALTCYSNQRAVGFYYHASSGGGKESPEAAAQTWAKDDEVLVDESGDNGTVVWVLRPDGTAHTKLHLRNLADNTWIVESKESCVGREGGLSKASQREGIQSRAELVEVEAELDPGRSSSTFVCANRGDVGATVVESHEPPQGARLNPNPGPLRESPCAGYKWVVGR